MTRRPMPEPRLWQMIRIGDGDYLLPSNDRTIMWRLQRYDEDGSATYFDGSPVKGTFWSLLRWRHPVESLTDPEVIDEFLWSAGWVEIECMIPTRKAAIAAAMSYVD